MSSANTRDGYHSAHDDDLSFRRGLVIGLTLAEISILIIFIVLLAFGATFAATRQEIAALEQQLPEERAAKKLIKTLADGGKSPQEAQDLAKQLIAATVKDDQFDQMRKQRDIAREKLKQMERVFNGAGASKDGKTPSQRLDEAIAREKGRWPPFFNLSEAGGYFFDSGRATLHPDFEFKLRSQVIPTLAQTVSQYNVDVVEVIGHTDEVPMSGSSNLDGELIQAAANRYPIADLRSTDNAGLAMTRAVAVASILRADLRLAKVKILPLSGAQMIVPVDRMADGTARGDDQLRRRIEIRLRRSTIAARAEVDR